jgi:hypothetical protein
VSNAENDHIPVDHPGVMEAVKAAITVEDMYKVGRGEDVVVVTV